MPRTTTRKTTTRKTTARKTTTRRRASASGTKATAPRRSNADIYADVTRRVIERMQAGVMPWQRPWDATGAPAVTLGMPANAATRRAYSGVNVLVLMSEQMANGYRTAGWVTFRQAIAEGAVVRKGEKGTAIVFMRKVSVRDREAGESSGGEGEDGRRDIWMARQFVVFNVDQLADLPDSPGAVDRLVRRMGGPLASGSADADEGFDAIAACEAMVRSSGATIRHGGDRAFYRPASDSITMPPRKAFATREGYYGTLFHELAHWTGAPHRLDRPLLNMFGSERYALEELVAEMASAFVSATFGIEHVSQSAAYVDHWLACLTRHDAEHRELVTAEDLTGPRALVRCATMASAAANYLLGLAGTAGTAGDDEGEDAAAA